MTRKTRSKRFLEELRLAAVGFVQLVALLAALVLTIVGFFAFVAWAGLYPVLVVAVGFLSWGFGKLVKHERERGRAEKMRNRSR